MTTLTSKFEEYKRQWEREHPRAARHAILADDCRRTGLFIHPFPTMNDDLYEFRYEQRGKDYVLRCWHNGVERSYRGLDYEMPEWLKAILVTAKVAGALPKIPEPPPDAILWFRTDKDRNLVEFIEMT